MRSGYQGLPGIWLDGLTVYSDHHVFWLVQGLARVWVDEQQHVLRSGDLLWLPAGTTVTSIQTETGSVALSFLVARTAAPDPSARARLLRPDPAAGDALVAAYVRWIMPFWVEHATVESPAALSRSGPATIAYPPLPDRSPALDVATALLRDPADPRTLREWARLAGTGERNLARSFRAGTGLTFGAWRSALRVAHGVRLLAQGLTPGQTAAAVGYGSTAAFDHVFARVTGGGSGLSPGRARALVLADKDSSPAGPDDNVPGPDRLLAATGADLPAATTLARVNDFHVLVWMFRGRALVEIGTRRLTMTEGEAVWLPAGVRNRIHTEPGGIVVPVGDLPADRPLGPGCLTPVRVPPGRAPEMLYRSAASYTYLCPSPALDTHLSDLLPSAPSHLGPGTAVDRILAAPPTDTRTLRDWARELGLPADDLARRLNRVTGTSYRSWRSDRRMTFARALLTRPGARATDVAATLGYADLSAFSRAFTRHHGHSPSAFQRRYRRVAHVVAG